MKRDCGIDGHVTVDQDLECLVCGELIAATDIVGLHFNREHGAFGWAGDIATPDEWGHANTGLT